jgi:hypothetical protein
MVYSVVEYHRFSSPCCLQFILKMGAVWASEIWFPTTKLLRPEYEVCMDIWNVGVLPQHYAAPQPRSTRIFTAMKISNLFSAGKSQHERETKCNFLFQFHIWCLYLQLQVEDGGSMVLRNADILPCHSTASQPRRPRLRFERCFDVRNMLPIHVTNIHGTDFFLRNQ